QDRFEKVAISWVRVPPVAGNVPAPSDSDLRRLYERYQGEMCGPAATKLEVLIVPKPIAPTEVASVREQAKALTQRARHGEDFAGLARSYSEGANAEQGGTFPRAMTSQEMGPALSAIIAPLAAGGVTDPQQETNQFTIFRVDSISKDTPPRYRI